MVWKFYLAYVHIFGLDGRIITEYPQLGGELTYERCCMLQKKARLKKACSGEPTSYPRDFISFRSEQKPN
jgi:hypothetical protein